jgi:3-hydroxyisobutyrate dehydrogenase
MTVGFVGVGAMGLPMARNVLRERPVVFFDPDPGRAAQLTASGAAAADSPGEVAERVDVVIVMVATPAQLEQAMFGDLGAADGLRPGQTLIVMSSVGIDAVRSLESRLDGAGVLLVDAPVTGGVARAITGELTILVGASEQAINEADPVLKLMGTRVARCGTNVGDGQAVKLVNQLLCSVHLVAAAEALSLASALGLDPAVVLETIQHGAAASFMLSDRGPRMLSVDEPPVLSAIDIFVKDSSLVLAAAAKASVAVPLTERAAEQFAAAQSRGWGRRDDSSVFHVYAR